MVLKLLVRVKMLPTGLLMLHLLLLLLLLEMLRKHKGRCPWTHHRDHHHRLSVEMAVPSQWGVHRLGCMRPHGGVAHGKPAILIHVA